MITILVQTPPIQHAQLHLLMARPVPLECLLMMEQIRGVQACQHSRACVHKVSIAHREQRSLLPVLPANTVPLTVKEIPLAALTAPQASCAQIPLPVCLATLVFSAENPLLLRRLHQLARRRLATLLKQALLKKFSVSQVFTKTIRHSHLVKTVH